MDYAFNFIVPQMEGILNDDDHIFIKIERLVTEYMDLLMKTSSFLPLYCMRSTEILTVYFRLLQNSGINPEIFIDQFMEEMQKGNIRRHDPRQLIINILSLCIFPIAARPLMQRIFFGNNEKVYNQFLEERKKVVADFIIQSIKT